MTGGGDGPGVVYVKAGSIYRANIMTTDGPRFTEGPEVIYTTPRTFTLKLAMDVPGIAYAVVVKDGDAAPSCSQVAKRESADGSKAHASGFAMHLAQLVARFRQRRGVAHVAEHLIFRRNLHLIWRGSDSRRDGSLEVADCITLVHAGSRGPGGATQLFNGTTRSLI